MEAENSVEASDNLNSSRPELLKIWLKSFLFRDDKREVLSDSSIYGGIRGKSRDKFRSKIGIIFSCLGCVVGTGNVWRFPRICAQNAGENGGLTFIIIWCMFLVLWSMPISIAEYTLGRFSRCGPFLSFYKFLGTKFIWAGLFIVVDCSFLLFYYAVIVGWTIYFFGLSCKELPNTYEESQQNWDSFINSYYPFLCHLIVMALVSLCFLGGLKWIEKANKFLVPLLLLMIFFAFIWSLTRDSSEVGIRFLFTLDPKSFAKPTVWKDAITQNAYDTGAGLGLYTTYASYLSRTDEGVKFGTILPIMNNLVSLICGVTIFSTVFSTFISIKPFMSRHSIIHIMKDAGPGGTGLTFLWLPVLFSKVGGFGRFLCPLFFMCLAFSGITSVIPMIELMIVFFRDVGLSYTASVTISLVIATLLGMPSALSIDFLNSEDGTWSFGLILTGLFFALLVLIYGVNTYRSYIVNKFGIGDYKLRIHWTVSMMVFVPILALTIFGWSIYDNVSGKKDWYVPKIGTFMVVIIELLIAILFMAAMTFYCHFKKPKFLEKARVLGYDPTPPVKLEMIEEHSETYPYTTTPSY